MSEEQNSPEEPINAGNKESPEVEAAVNDTGGPGDTPASEIEAADEAAAADGSSVDTDVTSADDSAISESISVVSEQPPQPAPGEPYVAGDGAVLGRDFQLPGVAPGDNDPYKWHTGAKIAAGGTAAIEIKDLTKQFGRTRILNGLNLDLPDDQISMVLGPSGTGKSVLIKHIVGLLYPDSGDVIVKGDSVPALSDDDLFEMRKKFGLLFQDGALFGSMNIYDNVAFPLRGPLQDAERALRRNAQARRFRPRAGARPRDRHVRRARLGPRPGSHRIALRAHQGSSRRKRRLLHGDQSRPRHCPADRGLHRRALEGPDRRKRAEG